MPNTSEALGFFFARRRNKKKMDIRKPKFHEYFIESEIKRKSFEKA